MSIRRAVLTSLVLLFSGSIAQAGAVFYAIAYGNAPIVATVDPNTGAATPIGAALTGYGHDIAVSPTGSVYAVIDTDLYSINKVTGAAALIGSFGGPAVQSIAF